MATRTRKAVKPEPESKPATAAPSRSRVTTAASSRPKRNISTTEVSQPAQKRRKTADSGIAPRRSARNSSTADDTESISGKPSKQRESKISAKNNEQSRNVSKKKAPAIKEIQRPKGRRLVTSDTNTRVETHNEAPSLTRQISISLPPRNTDDDGYTELASQNVAKADETGSHDDDEDQKSYWLMKAEPRSRIETTESGAQVDVKFSIDDLQAKTEPEPWEGIRNLVAQKNLKSMKCGDMAFFYASNIPKPGVLGVMEIVQEASPDMSAFSKDSPYYDSKSDSAKPKWQLVHVEYRGRYAEMVSLRKLQSFAKDGGVLADMQMLKQSRLSVSKVTAKEWRFINSLAGPLIDPLPVSSQIPAETDADVTDRKEVDVAMIDPQANDKSVHSEAAKSRVQNEPLITADLDTSAGASAEMASLLDEGISVKGPSTTNTTNNGEEIERPTLLDENVISVVARENEVRNDQEELINTHESATFEPIIEEPSLVEMVEHSADLALHTHFTDVTNQSVASVDVLDTQPDVTSPIFTSTVMSVAEDFGSDAIGANVPQNEFQSSVEDA